MNDDRRRLDDTLAIAGMRDRTIHRYPDVDLDVLWDTLEHDLPQLAHQIRRHLDGADG